VKAGGPGALGNHFMFEVKKTGLIFLNFTFIPTFAFPKKAVDQCDVKGR
jgi:hypothetical protein